MKKRILAIGSVTKDHIITPDDEYYQIGGAVYYQLMTLIQLKKDVISIISIGKNDMDMLNNILKKQEIITYKKTLEYTNIYDKNMKRTQKAKFPKNTIKETDIKISLENITYAIISPLTPEDISPETIKLLKKNNIKTVLVAQGHLRQLDSYGNIIERKWTDKDKYLENTDIICLDEKEAMQTFDTKSIKENLEKYKLEQIIITRAEKGSTIYTRKETYHIPAIKCDKITDPTGLGDTYIAAYIAKLDETKNIYESGLYASITAKEKLKNKGPLKTDKKEIEKELNEYRQGHKWNNNSKNK